MSARQVLTTLQHPPLHAAARGYHAHHFECGPCIGAGLGNGDRCNVGAGLWSAYLAEVDAVATPPSPAARAGASPFTQSHQRLSATRAQALNRQEQFA